MELLKWRRFFCGSVYLLHNPEFQRPMGRKLLKPAFSPFPTMFYSYLETGSIR